MIDQPTLTCILMLGYPPAECLRDKPEPLFSRDMGDTDLDEYCIIVEDAIISRASRYDNWVELSGGWDSTIILATLRKHLDADKVRAVFYTADTTNGQCFNPFEFEKALAIAKFYGVSLDVVKVSPSDAKMIELWNGAKSHCLAEWMPAYWAMAETIKEKSEQKGTVFVGSYADSLHNFGFSQLVALPYLSYDFRSYGDKMMSYLYSPSFLEKVIKNDYCDDFIYKLFQRQHPEVDFYPKSYLSTRENRIFGYLLSFIFSGSRLPFAYAITSSPFLTPLGNYQFSNWLYTNYFKEAVEQITPETMYYWLIRLYQHFHLQGAERVNVEGSFAGSGIRVCQPYTDTNLVRFLQMMPENWGRGLEWRPTKYPLKQYGERLKIPREIIETEFHSYITETQQGRTADYHWELAQALSSSFSRDKLDLGIFNKEWFDFDSLTKILKAGDRSNPKLLLNLLSILNLAE